MIMWMIERKSPRKGTKTNGGMPFICTFPIERKSPRKGTKTGYTGNIERVIKLAN